MAGKVVMKTNLKREKGYLYYVDKEMNVSRAKMKRRTKSKKK